MNGKYVCNELVFNLLMMEYEVIGEEPVRNACISIVLNGD